MHIWNELTQCSGKKLGYQEMVGASIKGSGSGSTVSAKTLYIPLEFWFCRNPGLALPLIALTQIIGQKSSQFLCKNG
jgi:hypothetical protein